LDFKWRYPRRVRERTGALPEGDDLTTWLGR